MRACKGSSVVSNSVQPNGLWPARLHSQGDSLGKNAGVGCGILLQGFFPIQESNPLLYLSIYLLALAGRFFTPRFTWEAQSSGYPFTCSQHISLASSVRGSVFSCSVWCWWASHVAQTVRNPPAMWEIWVQSLSWEDPLEESMATHSIILAWRISWTEGICVSCSVMSDFATPWTVSPQAPLSMGFSRQEYWNGLVVFGILLFYLSRS